MCIFLSQIHLRIIIAVVTAHEVKTSVWPLRTRWHKMDQITISHRRRDWNVVLSAFLSSHGRFSSTRVSSWKPRNKPTQIQFQMQYLFFGQKESKAVLALRQSWAQMLVCNSQLSPWAHTNGPLLRLNSVGHLSLRRTGQPRFQRVIWKSVWVLSLSLNCNSSN